MEKIIILVCSLFLCGCWGTTKYIYKTPDFEMPARPELRPNVDDDGQQIRNNSLNYLDVIEYSLKLENILIEIKSKSGLAED